MLNKFVLLKAYVTTCCQDNTFIFYLFITYFIKVCVYIIWFVLTLFSFAESHCFYMYNKVNVAPEKKGVLYRKINKGNNIDTMLEYPIWSL